MDAQLINLVPFVFAGIGLCLGGLVGYGYAVVMSEQTIERLQDELGRAQKRWGQAERELEAWRGRAVDLADELELAWTRIAMERRRGR